MGCGASQSTTLINGELSGKPTAPKQVWLQVKIFLLLLLFERSIS